MAKAKKLPSGSWNVLVYAGKDPDGKPGIMPDFAVWPSADAFCK